MDEAQRERLAEIRAELRVFERAERDRLVRAGTRTPKTQREMRLYLDGQAERNAELEQRRAARATHEIKPADLDALTEATE